MLLLKKYEYTSNYLTGNTKSCAANITNALEKYKNEYSSTSTFIRGDALFLGSITGGWDTENPVIARGYNSLFNYGGSYYYSYGEKGGNGGATDARISSRACVVMGAGL